LIFFALYIFLKKSKIYNPVKHLQNCTDAAISNGSSIVTAFEMAAGS
jgi:hypothetical protein